MKKLFKTLSGIASMLFLLTFNTASAQQKISNVSLDALNQGAYDNTVIAPIGKTGIQLKAWLNDYCMAVSGHGYAEWVQKNHRVPLSQPHYNTQWTNGSTQVFFDRTPSGTMLTWPGIASGIKIECCQPVSTDQGVLTNFINGSTTVPVQSGTYQQQPVGSSEQIAYVAQQPQPVNQSQVIIVGGNNADDAGRLYVRKHKREEERNEYKQSMQDHLDIKEMIRDDESATIDHAKSMANKLGYEAEGSTWKLVGMIAGAILVLFILLMIIFRARG